MKSTEACNRDLLRRSLICRSHRSSVDESELPLSSLEEEALATHLEGCAVCRDALQSLAGDAEHWNTIQQTLLLESGTEHPRWGSAVRQRPLNSDDFDLLESGQLKPSDFIVEFLQPTDLPDSLGRLGSIEIRQFIGQGAHGVVLKGYQPELNRLVAVKVLAPHLATVVAARKRFAREARATAAIVHPAVMPILAVDSSGPLPFLVMPYVDCESLQDRIDREGPLPLTDLLRITIQVAHGLAAAHSQGLVHRDVKPANILLERGVERVMLTDFGLARTVDDATLTRSGLIAGTPHYMSPEQARGDLVDGRSDLFSLGSVIYCMITGRPPFRAETTFGILRRVTDEEPRPVRELQPETPEWLDVLTRQLLRKSLLERFDSAEQLASLLEDCLAHVQHPSANPLPRCMASSSLHQSKFPGRLFTGILIGLVLAAAVGLYWQTNRKPVVSHSADEPSSNRPDSAALRSSHRGVDQVALQPKDTADEAMPSDPEIEAALQQANEESEFLERMLESESAPSP